MHSTEGYGVSQSSKYSSTLYHRCFSSELELPLRNSLGYHLLTQVNRDDHGSIINAQGQQVGGSSPKSNACFLQAKTKAARHRSTVTGLLLESFGDGELGGDGILGTAGRLAMKR